MKKILLVFVCFFFAANVYSEKSECRQKAEETFKTEREACKDKKGDEKEKCLTDAKTKKKSSIEECQATHKACMEKARSEKQTAMDGCKEKKGEEKKEGRS